MITLPGLDYRESLSVHLFGFLFSCTLVTFSCATRSRLQCTMKRIIVPYRSFRSSSFSNLLEHPLPSHRRLGQMIRKDTHNKENFFWQEEVTTVELVDATDPGQHNDEIVADPEAGVASRTIPLDDFTSQANVSIMSVSVVEGQLSASIN